MAASVQRTALCSGLLAVAAMLAGVLDAPRATAQRAPLLMSEEMLRLVLPLDAGGRRPPVLAWGRQDAVSARDGSSEVFVVVLYETAAPFGQTDLRRLVNRLRWNGTRYEPDRADEAGGVMEGELRRLTLPRWSVEIEVASIAGEANPIYAVNYRGAAPSGEAPSGSLTVTELFRPSTELLWQRVTAASESSARDGGEEVRTLNATYALESPAEGPARLLATVVQATVVVETAGARPRPLESREYLETYLFRDGAYRLETRVLLSPR